jgi:hypothetical protein
MNMDICKPGSSSKFRIARGEDGAVIELVASPQDLLTVLEEKKKRQIFALRPGNEG